MVEQVTAEAGWRYREIATSHEAMVMAPRELTGVLLEAVAENGALLRS